MTGIADAARKPAEIAPREGRGRRAIAYALLIAWALLMFVPFAWTIITSLKDRPEALRVSLPANPDFEAWVYTWQSIDPGLPQMIVSSLLLAAIVTASNLFLGSMAGYAFARLTFPGRDALFVVVLATLMIPDQLRIVPVYQIMNFLGLINRSEERRVGKECRSRW